MDETDATNLKLCRTFPSWYHLQTAHEFYTGVLVDEAYARGKVDGGAEALAAVDVDATIEALTELLRLGIILENRGIVKRQVECATALGGVAVLRLEKLRKE